MPTRSLLGLVLGSLFVAASLTPSLTPRPPLLMGILAGICLSLGYLFGIILGGICSYLGLPALHVPSRKAAIAVLTCIVLAAALTWLGIGWQNDLRGLFGMERLSYLNVLLVLPIALITAGLLFFAGMATRSIFRNIARQLEKWIPRRGRQFVATGPSVNEISAVARGQVRQPIRVYAGLNSAPSVDKRARLALAELKRVGGFDRSVLVIIAPTGTGWVDSSAVDTLEFLQRGDVASVALQYSYLASWLSLTVEPGYGVDSARALFREVYAHWKSLPPSDRPKLYLFGLSLGALSSEASLDLFDVIEDPIQGALWAGPPFPSPLWRTATTSRNPGSPVWLPKFRDSSIVRFSNQQNSLAIPGARWGPMRIVYLQYGSDPITFFRPDSFYRKPEWLSAPRAPDVLPSLRWVPAVTFMQTGIDLITGMGTPPGTGHVFAAEDYLDSWIAVTEPAGWNEGDLQSLRAFIRARQRADQ